jgi:serine/threonine-protein phosphatase 4 regulatory subunit 1
VRRTLAHSLHELARLLGPTLSVTHLVPVFHTFLRDIDEVKIGVVTHLASFLLALPQQARLEFLDLCWELQTESDQNWRLRKLLAQYVFSAATVHFVLYAMCPQSSRLCFVI